MAHRLARVAAVGLLLAVLPGAGRAAPAAAVAAPTLKWAYGGCQAPPHYCETGWYASPAVADLDGDGKAEVIWGGYKLFALNGEDGSTQWSANNSQRIWPGVAVADLTGDGSLEVVVGRSGDQVTAYSAAGATLWTRNPFGAGEVRTLAVEDLEQDGRLEVIVGRAGNGSTRQVNVLQADGAQRAGWPARRDGEPGFGWGMYNENIAVADMDGDGRKEIFAPTDTHYITGLAPSGDQLPASPIYGAGKVWSQVGVHVDQAADLRGYANCGVEHRPNFANTAPAVADLDGDGTPELIVVGNVYNCATSPYTDLYEIPIVLKADRTRWSGGGFDWTALPAPEPGSGPVSQDFNVIESAAPNAVTADLDGDGRLEILYASYDGRLHAYWLDKTERGAWPFDVPGSGIRFASEPAVADLDNDGKAEVIFASWPQKGGGQTGQLIVLDAEGRQLHAVSLPAPGAGADWNGGLGAPTLANIDGDPDLEAVVGTSHSGAVAFDLPESAGARVLWGTGRGSLKRTGRAPAQAPALALSSPEPAIVVAPGGTATFRVDVGGASGPVTITAAAPVGPAPLPLVTVAPGSLTAPGRVTVTMADQRAAGAAGGASYAVTLTATGGGTSRTLTLRMIVGGGRVYLPQLRR
jgi:outer membrane protein assembly factor BamB